MCGDCQLKHKFELGYHNMNSGSGGEATDQGLRQINHHEAQPQNPHQQLQREDRALLVQIHNIPRQSERSTTEMVQTVEVQPPLLGLEEKKCLSLLEHLPLRYLPLLPSSPLQPQMLRGVQIAHHFSIPPRTSMFLFFPLLKAKYFQETHPINFSQQNFI